MQTLRSCDCPEGHCTASEAYLDQFDEVFKYSLPKGGQVAGFFAESIQVYTIKVNTKNLALAKRLKRVEGMSGTVSFWS